MNRRRALALAPALPVLALLTASACKVPDPPAITSAWRDDFERGSLGGDYLATQDSFTIRDGKLNVKGAYNHPLWLRRKLPADAVIEFDTWSQSPDGDIKVEAWGDGESYDPDKAGYLATSYVFIMGGWKNTRSIIAKRDEHSADVISRAGPRVEPGRRYHWKIARTGGHIDWYVDDMTAPFLTRDDAQPLEGKGHEYFGFNNWETDVWFDNLVVTPLTPGATPASSATP